MRFSYEFEETPGINFVESFNNKRNWDSLHVKIHYCDTTMFRFELEAESDTDMSLVFFTQVNQGGALGDPYHLVPTHNDFPTVTFLSGGQKLTKAEMCIYAPRGTVINVFHQTGSDYMRIYYARESFRDERALDWCSFQ